MTTDELRRRGHELIDWIADYLDRIETFPVLSQVAPGSIRSQLPENPPEKGESFDAMLADVEKIILPGITHWQSPNFFAYFPSNSSGPSILGELLSAGLGVQGMIWATSPAATELETHVMDWLVGMLGLPDFFHSKTDGGGVIQDTASSAALCALVAARERATDLATNRAGCRGDLVAYTSSQAHSSIEKAVKIAGIGREQLRLVEVDEVYAMSPEALADRIAADRKAGLKPFFVCATVGTTSSNAMDPLPEIGRSLARERASGSTSTPPCRVPPRSAPNSATSRRGSSSPTATASTLTSGCSPTSTVPHSTYARRKDLIDALTILPEYLRNEATASGAVIDYRDWHVQLGRRFRALKLWFVIRHYGIEGLRYHVRRHVALAQELAELDRRRRALRARRARTSQPRLLPTSRRRRGERGDHEAAERERPDLPHPHEARWPHHPAPERGSGADRRAPRARGLGAHLGHGSIVMTRWRTTRSETLITTPIFSVRRDRKRAPDDDVGHDFYVLECPDWVNVLPVTSDREAVLIVLHRHGTGEPSLEIPGGMIDPEDPTPRDAAAREMLEETGYQSDELHSLGFVHPNPALQSNRCYTYLAENARVVGDPRPDETEEIRVVLTPLDDLPRLVQEGKITHALVIAGLLRYFQSAGLLA